MGMDVYGTSGNYFRANIWSWRAICHAMELAGYDVPSIWGTNDGAGLETESECDDLADQLALFLERWDGDTLTLESQVHVDKSGCFVSSPGPDTHSAYWTTREHIQEFIEFLRNCGGCFEIL